MKLKFLAGGLLWAFLLASPALGREGDTDVLAELLFPASADWLKVSSLPTVTDEQWADIFPELKAALARQPESVLWGSETNVDFTGCAMDRLFDRTVEWYGLDTSYRAADVNEDGIEDILFSGSNPCAEGGLGVIWYGDGRGAYQVKARETVLRHIVKLKPGPGGPLKLTFEPGCCGDFIDEYYQDGAGEPDKYVGKIKAFNFREKAAILNQPLLNKRIIFKNWAELRESPEIKNEYYAEFSAGMGYLVVGNILTIVSSFYNEAPCRGTLLHYNPGGDWALVVLDAACAANLQLSYSKGDFLRLGWVESSSFEFEPAQEADE